MRFIVGGLKLAVAFSAMMLISVESAPATSMRFMASALVSVPQDVPVIEVRSRRNRAGAAVAGGIVGGIIGGIIASQQRPVYVYPGYPYYGSYYRPYPPYPVYRDYGPYDPAIAYCARRFRSYDPYSMTYLGYDGLRHSCP